MKQLFARLLGLDGELRKRQIAIDSLRGQVEALKKESSHFRPRINHQSKRNRELTELLEAQQAQVVEAAHLIREARRVSHLRHSGPGKAREYMTTAINLLEGDRA